MSSFVPRRTITKPQIQTAAPDPNAHIGSFDDIARMEQDTKIMQKVNAVHREAFTERYPGQIEHCLRLTMERLQAGLDKRGNVAVNDPNSWILPPVEIADLAKAAYYLHQIRNDIR